MAKVFKKNPDLKTSSPIHTTVQRVLTPKIQIIGEQWKGEPSIIKEFQPVKLQQVVSLVKKRDKNLMRVHIQCPILAKKSSWDFQSKSTRKAKYWVLRDIIAIIQEMEPKFVFVQDIQAMLQQRLKRFQGFPEYLTEEQYTEKQERLLEELEEELDEELE